MLPVKKMVEKKPLKENFQGYELLVSNEKYIALKRVLTCAYRDRISPLS